MRAQTGVILAAAACRRPLVAPPPRRPRACMVQSSPSDRFGVLPKAPAVRGAYCSRPLSGQQRDIDIALQLIEEMAATNVGKVPAKVVGALVDAAVATKDARRVDRSVGSEEAFGWCPELRVCRGFAKIASLFSTSVPE